MRLRPHPFAQGKLKHPAPRVLEGILLPSSAHQNPTHTIPQPAPIPRQRLRASQGACFNWGQPGRFAREGPTRDLAKKPTAPAAVSDDQVNLFEETVAAESTDPRFCVNFGMDGDSSQFQNRAIHKDLAYRSMG